MSPRGLARLGAALALAAAIAACRPVVDADTLAEAACPDEGTDLTYDSFGAPFLAAYCQTCHGSDAVRNGAPVGFVFDTHADVLRHRERIYVRAAGGNTTMPPGRDDPPREERDLLAEWLACGAP